MKSLTVIGRRWFHRRTGNTYHTFEILVDGQFRHKSDTAYGYGDQYLYNATVWLDANKLLDPPRETKDGTPGEPLWRWAERAGVHLHYYVHDVSRKKDL